MNVEISKFTELEDKIKHIVSEQVFYKKQIILKNKYQMILIFYFH